MNASAQMDVRKMQRRRKFKFYVTRKRKEKSVIAIFLTFFSRWEIILCDSCGSQGIHIACGKLKFHNPSWECCMCSKVPGGEATSGNISSASSGSDISVADSINSARSGRPSLRRRRLESRNLDDNSKRQVLTAFGNKRLFFFFL